MLCLLLDTLTRALDNLGLNGYWGPPPEDAAGLRSVLADLETELAFAPTPEAVDYLTHKREVWRGLLVEAEKREFLTPQQMAGEMGMMSSAAVERFITKGNRQLLISSTYAINSVWLINLCVLRRLLARYRLLRRQYGTGATMDAFPTR